MDLDLKPKQTSELLPTDILFQTLYWSRVKSRLGWRPLAFDLNTAGPEGDVLVLERAVAPGLTAAYVPQGPEHGPDPERYGPFLEELSMALAAHLDPSVAFIRYDLPWVSPYAPDPSADPCREPWTGPPPARVRELRMNFGTKLWSLRKAPVDLTVADSLVVDLTGCQDDVFARMKPKTRYNVRLAERRGVHVFAAGPELLPVFFDLYLQTAERDGFAARDYDYFRALFAELVAGHDAAELHFLLAAHESDILAGAIVALCGQTAYYLFGASSNQKRNRMGPYAVQWSAMRLARANGCRHYDMGAVSPVADPGHGYYGLYRFKAGFGGQVVHRSGSWDFLLDEERYREYHNIEASSQSIPLVG